MKAKTDANSSPVLSAERQRGKKRAKRTSLDFRLFSGGRVKDHTICPHTKSSAAQKSMCKAGKEILGNMHNSPENNTEESSSLFKLATPRDKPFLNKNLGFCDDYGILCIK